MRRAFSGLDPLVSILLALAISTAASASAAAPKFKQQRLPLKASSLTDLRLADLNSDGFADLVIIQSTEKAISVYMGKATQGYTTKYTRKSVDLGSEFTGITDVDGDGKLDVVARCSGSDKHFAIFKGLGNGKLAAPKVIARADSAESVLDSFAIADVNRDGLPDIVGVDGGEQIHAFINIGKLTFQSVITEIESGYGPVVSADFNGDGINDLALGNGSYPYAVLTYKGAGDGSFALYKQTKTTWFDPHYTAAADFDQDGRIDVLGSFSDSVWVMKGKGNGTFGKPVGLGATGEWYDISGMRIVDVNGDKKLDVTALGAFSGVWVYVNKGGGKTDRPVAFANSVGFEPKLFDVADVNNDHKPDVAACIDGMTDVLLLLNGQTPATLTMSNLVVTSMVYSDGFYKGVTVTGQVSFSGSGIDIRYTGKGGASENAYLYVQVKCVYTYWPYTVYARGYLVGSFLHFPGQNSGTIYISDVFLPNGVISSSSVGTPTLELTTVRLVDYNLVSSNTLP